MLVKPMRCCCVAGVPEAVLLLLAACMEHRILSPGHNLAAAGAPADAIWLLRHGSVLAAHPDMLVRWH
jgi:CRP-like cAMP-binding protein